MKRLKLRIRMALVILSVFVTVLGFSLWRSQYSMGIANSYEIGLPLAQDKILIATQSSEFKDSLVRKITEGLKSEPVAIKVIDINGLPNIDPDAWSAILVIHTWENGRPPSQVRHFVDGPVDVRKLVVLTTSSSADKTIVEVDGVSAASQLHDVPQYTNEVLGRIKNILSRQL
ncbi:MAG: hypothetical protein AAFN93_08775 [Bacteroidota bacterium]